MRPWAGNLDHAPSLPLVLEKANNLIYGALNDAVLSTRGVSSLAARKYLIAVVDCGISLNAFN